MGFRHPNPFFLWDFAERLPYGPASGKRVLCACGRMGKLSHADRPTAFSCPAPRQIRRSPAWGCSRIGVHRAPCFSGIPLPWAAMPPFCFWGRSERRPCGLARVPQLLPIPFLHGILSSVARAGRRFPPALAGRACRAWRRRPTGATRSLQPPLLRSSASTHPGLRRPG